MFRDSSSVVSTNQKPWNRNGSGVFCFSWDFLPCCISAPLGECEWPYCLRSSMGLRLTERKDERSLVCIGLAGCGRSQRTRENPRMDGHEMQKCSGRQMLDVLQNDIQQTGSMAGIFRVCSQGRDYIYPDQRPDHKLKKDGANEQKRIQHLVWRKTGCYSGAADVDILSPKNV